MPNPMGFAWRAKRPSIGCSVITNGLKWVLRHQSFMLLVALGTVIATVWLYIVVPKGFFPQQDTGVMFGTTEAGQDVSFTTMARLQNQVVRIVLADPAVETLGSFIGAATGQLDPEQRPHVHQP